MGARAKECNADHSHLGCGLWAVFPSPSPSVLGGLSFALAQDVGGDWNNGDMSKSNGWADGPWIGFDTETTGVSPRRDRIVTAATVRRDPLAILRAGGGRGGAGREGGCGSGRSDGDSASRDGTVDEVRTWLANPGVPIPASAANIHGISTEYAVRHGAPAAQVVEEVAADLAAGLDGGGTIVVFNAGFDLPLLNAEASRNGVTSLSGRVPGGFVAVADPLVLDRALDPYRKGKRTLADLADVYGVKVPSDTHQAHVDATLTLDLLAALVERYPVLEQMGAAELHEFQVNAHRDWAVNFQAFMRSKGRDVTIDPNWF